MCVVNEKKSLCMCGEYLAVYVCVCVVYNKKSNCVMNTRKSICVFGKY